MDIKTLAPTYVCSSNVEPYLYVYFYKNNIIFTFSWIPSFSIIYDDNEPCLMESECQKCSSEESCEDLEENMVNNLFEKRRPIRYISCLLYTSDAADE